MAWFKEFGWNSNPFQIKPDSRIVSLEDAKEKLLSWTKSGDAVYIVGRTGTERHPCFIGFETSFQG